MHTEISLGQQATFDFADYPNSYRQADDLSRHGQNRYMRSIKAELILACFVAIVADLVEPVRNAMQRSDTVRILAAVMFFAVVSIVVVQLLRLKYRLGL